MTDKRIFGRFVPLLCLIPAVVLFALGIVTAFLVAETGAQSQGGSLHICLAAAADYSPVYPTRAFPAGATNEVAAVVRLEKVKLYSTMTATWIAVDVDATPKNYVIKKMDLQMQGKDRAGIKLWHAEGLRAGKYRLDVEADGKPWRSDEFTVAPLPRPAEVKEPRGFLPLSVGTVWRYSFEQQFAPNVRPKLPAGMKLDADRKLRATLTKKVIKIDDIGAQVETRRNEALVEEEWWRLTEAGLVIVRIKSGDDMSTFDPPQPLWPWPPAAPRQWVYEPPDKSFRQAFRMWGPVPVKGLAGEAPGYVVLMEQPSPSISISVERHYLPGVGLVREAAVQARNGVMVTGWESVIIRP